ncbi:MAG: hypothetical protein JSV00_02905 [bacterium]|nr:MAG: hypothetical protein JSV00_02905 [bacterium]
MRKWNPMVIVLSVALGMGLVMGCGGGGGGGGGSESVNYDGSQDPAVIDTTSAVALAKNSVEFMNSDPSGGSGPLAVEGGAFTGMVKDPSRAVEYALGYFRNSKNDGSVQSLSASVEPLAVMCQSGFWGTGSAGGEIWLEICGDPAEMQGTVYFLSIGFDFRDYDDGTEYLDGELVVQGIYDEDADGGEGDFVDDIRVIFRDLTTLSASEDSYIDGWVDYDESAGVYTITYNLFLVDNDAQDAVWLSNYTYVMNDNDDTVTVNGRLYDYDDGYVDVTTETPLAWAMHYDVGLDELVFDDTYPTGGLIRLTGAGGAWIEIEFRDNAGTPELQVTVDVDNEPTDDPLWEWQSSWQSWVPG